MKEGSVQPAISVSSLEEAPESWRRLPERAAKAPGFLSPLGLKQGHSCHPTSFLAESRRLHLL